MRGVVKWGRNRSPPRRLSNEICDFVANQQAVFLGGHYILRAAGTGDTGAGGGGRLSARRENPWQAGACRKGSGPRWRVARYPSVCDVSGIFFSDVIFLWLPCLLLFFFFLFLFPFLSCLWLSRASPGGAGCRERSQRSCLRPGGLPPLTRNPGLQQPFRSRPLCWRRGLRSRHPGKKTPGWRNAVSRTRLASLRRVPAHCLPGATHHYESLSPGADTATTCPH